MLSKNACAGRFEEKSYFFTTCYVQATLKEMRHHWVKFCRYRQCFFRRTKISWWLPWDVTVWTIWIFLFLKLLRPKVCHPTCFGNNLCLWRKRRTKMSGQNRQCKWSVKLKQSFQCSMSRPDLTTYQIKKKNSLNFSKGCFFQTVLTPRVKFPQ